MKSWLSTSVSVADLDEVLKLWHESFGLAIIEKMNGDDKDLTRLWGLSEGGIKQQAVLATPGVETGMIHFVEFEQPSAAFRENAGKFDLCPKNLDVYVKDMPERVEALRSAGYTFQQENYNEMTAPDGTVFREIHMSGHDAINIVLIEIMGMPLTFTEQGFAAMGPVVTVVNNVNTERDFYHDIIGLDLLNDNLLEGPVVENMLGLPAGGAMEISIWGEANNGFGRMQLVDYRGAVGTNLYPDAVPKQRGILQVCYETQNLAELTGRLDAADIAWTDAGELSVLQGEGQFIRFKSPVGFQIDAFQKTHKL